VICLLLQQERLHYTATLQRERERGGGRERERERERDWLSFRSIAWYLVDLEASQHPPCGISIEGARS